MLCVPLGSRAQASRGQWWRGPVIHTRRRFHRSCAADGAPARDSDDRGVDSFDLPGALRRIRRRADLSQRDLAARLGISPSCVSKAEAGRQPLRLDLLVAAAALAGLRLALLDADGQELVGMTRRAVRDGAGRLFPAHLDTRYGDDDWWHGPHRYDRPQPWYTFDRSRGLRDHYREVSGTPADHQLPQPGDAPEERRAARKRELRHRLREARAQRLAAGDPPSDDDFTCSCPPGCAELEDWSGRPAHAEACPCRCDVG